MKRIFDIAVATFGLVVTGLPMLVAAILVKATSKGPIFYRQTRIGLEGSPFTLYKFRTMRVAPAGAGPSVTAEGDTRITGIGRLLRRTKIDELPQLWNVIAGDMSIIGPRPEVERFVRLYAPEQRRILEAKPGLASMAQLVFPHEAELLKGQADPDGIYAGQIVPHKIAIDLEYEARRTLVRDLGLILEIGLMILGKRPREDRSLRLETPPRS